MRQDSIAVRALPLLLLLATSRVHATTITVDTLADTGSVDDAVCSLREAILSSNANADVNPGFAACHDGAAYGADTIRFDVSGTILLASALPTLTDSSETTILGDTDGDSDLDVNVSGASLYQPFSVAAGGIAHLMSIGILNGHNALDGGGLLNAGILQITRCLLSTNTSDGDGGGILTSGALAILDTTLTGNIAGSDGGAVYNQGGTLIIRNSRLLDNQGGYGGAVFNLNPGSVTLSDSVLSNNFAGRYGGGISSSGTASVFGSTLSGNVAAIDGGGIYEEAGSLTTSNSTYSGGGAKGNGGAIMVVAGEADLENVTITGSGATAGGGLFVSPQTDVALSNTIVAGNTTGGNCAGTGAITDGTVNLDDGTSCGFGGGSLSGVAAGLGPLANNGGPTPTHALLAGSPAIDAGFASICASAAVGNLDQRGEPRPVDGNGDATAQCDIGAFEAGTLSVVQVPTLDSLGLALLGCGIGGLALRRLRRG